MSRTAASGSLPRPSPASSWAWSAPALLMALVAAGIGFRAPVAAAVETWSRSPSYEHGYAVAAVAAVLIWIERGRILREQPRPSPIGLVLAAAGAAIAALGAAAAVQVAGQIAFVLFLNAAVMAVLGPRVWRILSFPLLYLLFAVPIGETLLPWLRGFAAQAIVTLLTLAGAPAVLDGYLIRLPNADYRVAEACSGLRFLLVSLAAGVLAARLLLRSWPRRLVFLAVAAILPLLANALRSALLIWLAARGVLDPASAALHLSYGLGFTAVLLVLLMLLAWILRQEPAPPRPGPMAAKRTMAPAATLICAGIVALLAFLPAAIQAESGRTGPPPRLAAPSVGGAWMPVPPDEELAGSAARSGADASLAGAWTRGEVRVDLLILYFQYERQGAEAVGMDLADGAGWTEVGEISLPLALGGGELKTPARIQERDGVRRYVLTWYWVEGRFSAGAVETKLRQIGARLIGRPQPSARLRLIVSGAAVRDEPTQGLGQFLADLEPLERLLGAAEGGSTD